jgi:WXG100 family type VII secretion target
MDALRVDFGAAEATLAALRAARSRIAAELQTLEGAARTLSGGWTGEAQVAYATAQQQWSTTMTEMTTTLAAASDLLDGWIRGMQQLERDLAAGWPG